MTSAQLREKEGDGSLSVQESIVGLYKIETEEVRPSLAILLGQETFALPTIDIGERASQEGYNSFFLPGLVREWSEVRNVTVAMVENMNNDTLSMQSPSHKDITLHTILDQWVRREQLILTAMHGFRSAETDCC